MPTVQAPAILRRDAAELEAVEVPKDTMGEDETRMRDKGVYFARARLTEAAFRDCALPRYLLTFTSIPKRSKRWTKSSKLGRR